MNQSERRRYLIQELLNEQKEYSNYSIPEDSQGQKDLLRGLLNVRAPKMLSREFLKIQDEYLKEETEKKASQSLLISLRSSRESISGRVILLRFAVTRSSMRRTVE